MSHRSENFDARLAGLQKKIAVYADELRKLTTELNVTYHVTNQFDALFSEAVQMNMTDDEIRSEFVVLNTPMTQVVDTNPNRGYWRWSLKDQKYVWKAADWLCLNLMSPLQYQHWVYDVGRTVGIKNVPAKAPPPRPRPTPSADTDMTVTTSVCPETGVRMTVYMPKTLAA